MESKEKFLENDESVIRLTNQNDFHSYLTFREEHDVWYQPFINEMAVVGIANEPLFVPGYCKNPKIKKNGYIYDVESLDHDSEEVQECIASTGIFLCLPQSGHYKAYPIREFAYDTICKRAGDDCPTMTRFEYKANKKVLPVTEKAERLTRDFGLYSDICKILYRDCKVSVVLTKEYCIMSDAELIRILEEQLKNTHPDYCFVQAEISHTYLNVLYRLNDPENEETFRLKLNDYGCNIERISCGVEFVTSDVGLSRVLANIYYDIDDVRIYSEHGIGIRHDNGATTNDFQMACKNLGTALTEAEDQIELLGNTPINNIPRTVERVLKKYTYFPKELTAQAISQCRIDYPAGGNAVDCYLVICRLLDDYLCRDTVTLSKKISLTEAVSKMMSLPYDRIDSSFTDEW